MAYGKRNKIVVWCNELASVRLINDTASQSFQVLLARDSVSLSYLINQDEAPTAVMIDNTAAQNSAIEVLQSVRKACPDTRRILLTDYCDLGIIIQGLHTQAVQKIVYKPIHGPELLAAIGVQALSPMMSVHTSARKPMPRAVG